MRAQHMVMLIAKSFLSYFVFFTQRTQSLLTHVHQANKTKTTEYLILLLRHFSMDYGSGIPGL
jgi:hypothetical protein